MSSYATLFLKNLEYSGFHGCDPGERRAPQPFRVDIDMVVDISRAVQTDRLGDTYDYVHAREVARSVIEDESHALIETIASEIVRRIKLEQKVRNVTVELTKLNFSQNGVSGIRLSDDILIPMEMVMDTKGLDKPCACGSGKPAGQCCRKDEKCYCGSGMKVSECCMKPAAEKGQQS